MWSKISNVLKRLAFRARNFFAQLLSETSRACTIRVPRSTIKLTEALSAASIKSTPETPETMTVVFDTTTPPDRAMRAAVMYNAEPTPLLMIHGDMDFVPIMQPGEFFTALYQSTSGRRSCATGGHTPNSPPRISVTCGAASLPGLMNSGTFTELRMATWFSMATMGILAMERRH